MNKLIIILLIIIIIGSIFLTYYALKETKKEAEIYFKSINCPNSSEPKKELLPETINTIEKTIQKPSELPEFESPELSQLPEMPEINIPSIPQVPNFEPNRPQIQIPPNF